MKASIQSLSFLLYLYIKAYNKETVTGLNLISSFQSLFLGRDGRVMKQTQGIKGTAFSVYREITDMVKMTVQIQYVPF